ncbi:MAG: thiol oxidoreductase, partial [Acidobacteria bacterium]|nr:thiol oxidoreductase [Acidobacteriota bacterium]
MIRRAVPIALVLCLALALPLYSQSDPGVRPGAAAAGGPLASVAANSPVTILGFFNDGLVRFREVDSVAGALLNEDGKGLGPRYNSRSCAACHAQPATGGSSPAVNPQVGDASADGALNSIPSFITTTGPVREARFIFFTDIFGFPDPNQPNGGVEDLYTIRGRVDAGACNIGQPDFATNVATGNVIFRIPTPLFGTGLMENIPEEALLTNQSNQSFNSFGIGGTFNHNGNDGTISRFGWKAQNKSLELFA